MSAVTPDSPLPTRSAAHSTGPKTPQGKAAASRNSTAHGLHAQDAVLPHLGESQHEFDALCDGLARELSPRTAVERHYVTQIAQAMWRLRRLTRWEASLYDDPALTDEERIGKMARVLRHDAALRRHIDRALKALSNAPAICQNEPAPCTGMARHAPTPAPHYWGGGGFSDSPGIGGRGPYLHPLPEGEVSWLANSEGSPTPPELGAGGRSSLPPPIRAGALRKAQKLKQLKKCQNEPV